MAKRRLSEQQKRRIAHIQQVRQEKMAKRADEAAEQATDIDKTGLVITRHGQNVMVEDNQGDMHLCLFRQNIGDITCGDQVIWQTTEQNKGVVIGRIERKNALYRTNFSGEGKPLAANLTQMVIVFAFEPEPSEFLLDQYLIAAENLDIQALILINKADLIDPADYANYFQYYQKIGYQVLFVSAHETDSLTNFRQKLKHQRSIFVGQSGVGKSSLINTLLPNLAIQVGRLSKLSKLGRHTTSSTTLYHLPESGELIDSAGVRSFRLGKIKPYQLEKGFRDLSEYFGQCKFNNCQHQTEPDCALLNAVKAGKIKLARLQNFQRFLAEMT